MGTNVNLSPESFAFLDYFRFETTEWCKPRTTVIALPDRKFNSSSCLPSIVKATTRNLNVFVCFNDFRQLANLKMDFLSFGSTDFHSSNVTCCCKASSCALEVSVLEEASKTKSFA